MDSLSVLVIDDKQVIGDLFDFTLGYSGHRITYVNNGIEALTVLKSSDFDIIFLDIIIPEKDGVAILEDIKTIRPDIPVIMMSGYSVEEKQIKAKELGAVTCLKKPFEMDDVRKVVKLAIGREI